jgi:hypothetical protein
MYCLTSPSKVIVYVLDDHSISDPLTVGAEPIDVNRLGAVEIPAGALLVEVTF